MAANFSEIAPQINLAESPIVYNLYDGSTDPTKDSYQMCLDVRIFKGDVSLFNSTEPYTLCKFPIPHPSVPNFWNCNFDISNIVDSFMQKSLADGYMNALDYEQYFIYAQAYSKWKVGGSYVTSTKYLSQSSRALNGYLKWGERQMLASSSEEPFSDLVDNWPILTGAPVNVSQSIVDTSLPFYYSQIQYTPEKTINDWPQFVVVEGSNGNSYMHQNPWTNQEIIDNSYRTVANYMITGSDSVFVGSEWVSIKSYGSTSNLIGEPINIQIDCQKKYTPTRIIFKNRYGAFDQFEFSLVSTNSFDVSTKEYDSNALDATEPIYNRYNGTKTYFTEGRETLTVNSDYVDESFNDFFKQLMASDEIYHVLNPDTSPLNGLEADLQPLTLISKNLQFKKQEVDKLINYQFVFKYGTPFKLTL